MLHHAGSAWQNQSLLFPVLKHLRYAILRNARTLDGKGRTESIINGEIFTQSGIN